MVELKAISYEESRLEYFRKQRDSAKRRMNYWCGAKQADRVGWMEASDRASEASAQYNFYKDALEALAAQPKWISVEERLPELGEYFVRCIHNYTDNDEYECYKVAIYLSKECRWIDVGNLLKVTHWMPIPELPKECKHVREL